MYIKKQLLAFGLLIMSSVALASDYSYECFDIKNSDAGRAASIEEAYKLLKSADKLGSFVAKPLEDLGDALKLEVTVHSTNGIGILKSGRYSGLLNNFLLKIDIDATRSAKILWVSQSETPEKGGFLNNVDPTYEMVVLCRISPFVP